MVLRTSLKRSSGSSRSEGAARAARRGDAETRTARNGSSSNIRPALLPGCLQASAPTKSGSLLIKKQKKENKLWHFINM